MSVLVRIGSTVACAALALTLAACSPGTSSPAPDDTSSDAGDTSAEPSQSDDAAGGCPTPSEPDLVPFSSDLVTEPIPEGAIYGDGSEISFTTSLGPGLYPNMELLYWVGDTVTSSGAGNWEDAGDGKYTNNLNVFNSDLDGQPGLVEVSVFPDGVTFDGERYDGDNVVLGIYCITYAVE